MKISLTVSVFLSVVLFFSCQQTTTIDKENIKKKIMAVLNDQMRYWNEGDIEKYMAGYDRSDSLRFASGGKVSYGWENTLERYKNGYPDKSAMGLLTFSEIDITVISQDAAFVFPQPVRPTIKIPPCLISSRSRPTSSPESGN